MIDTYRWVGVFEIQHKNGIDIVRNRIMQAAITQLRDILSGSAPALQITHLAIGTSSTAITGAETQLGAEIFRTPVALQASTAYNIMQTSFVILDTEAVGTWAEIGIFCEGTMAANSGTLLSRILYSKVKTASEEITITRTDTFT